MINLALKVELADPLIDESELNRVYSSVTYNHDLSNVEMNYTNSNQIDALDNNRNIDPIYNKIKKMSAKKGHAQMADYPLDVKHKLNNDIS